MQTVLERKLEHWEHELLDLGKRNQMIHYREFKRSTIKLVEPSFAELFRRIAIEEEALTFKRPVDRNSDMRTFSMLELLENLSHPIHVSIGDIDTESNILERQKTLKNLRTKARLALDEQGTNILYMVAGFIEWREDATTRNSWVKSPLIMVPVTLSIESVNAPFVLKRYEEDIVVNPTLTYHFKEKYGIALPSFDHDEESPNQRKATIEDFLTEMEELVDKRGWKITREISLGLLSFLKINMYRDLQNNKGRLLNNPVLRAISGENMTLGHVDAQLCNFDHDCVPAKECFQVVSADASQQDAVLLSRKGVSFVMQGPPGTGKSQTITNIIAQALADGKKVLFVSEKRAALQVVYRRLQEVRLAEFCLPLHSYKANKKEILEEIGKSLNLHLEKVKEEAISELYTFNLERQKLNKYAGDLHAQMVPLGMSVYQVYGALNSLASASDVYFELHGVEEFTKEQFRVMQYVISEYASAINKMGDGFRENPWHGSTVTVITHDLKEQISRHFPQLANEAADLCSVKHLLERVYSFGLLRCWDDFVPATEVLSAAVKMSGIPVDWVFSEDLGTLLTEASKNQADLKKYWGKYKAILLRYSHTVFDIDDAQALQKQISDTRMRISALVAHRTSPDVKYSTYLEEINDAATSLIEALRQIEEDISCIRSVTGYSPTANFENIIRFYELAQLVRKNPKVTAEWFAIKEFSELKKLHNDAKILWSDLIKLQNEILEFCEPSIFDLPAQQMLNDLHSYQDVANQVLTFFCESETAGDLTLGLLDRFIVNISPKVDSIQQVWTNSISENQILTEVLGFPRLVSCSDIKKHIVICEAALHPIYPQASWAEVGQTSQSYELLKNCRNTHDHIKALKQEILATCDATAFELDWEGILKRYKTEYTSITKWFKLIGFYELAQLVRKNPKVTAEWFAIKEFSELKKLHNDAKILWSDLIKLQNEILEFCEPSIFNLPAQQMLNDLHSYQDVANQVLTFFCESETAGDLTLGLLDRFIVNISPKVDSIQQAWTNSISKNQVLTEVLGFPRLAFCSDIKQHIVICEAALHPIYPQASWAEVDQTSQSYELLKNCRNNHDQIKALKQEILATCDATAFELDYEGILKRYKTEYINFFKWFKHSYHEDRKAVRAVYKDVVRKLPDSQIISLLQNLKSIGEAQAWLDRNQEAVSTFAGRHYYGAETDWDKIFHNIEMFKQHLPLFDATENAVKALSITSDSDLQAVQSYLSYLTDLEVIIEISEALQEISNELSGESITGIIDRLNDVVINSTEFESLFKVVLSHIENSNTSYESLVGSLKKLAAYGDQKALFEHSESNMNTYLPDCYNGANTDWDQIALDTDCLERIHSCFSDFPMESLKELQFVQNAEEVLSNWQTLAVEERINHIFELFNSVASDQKTKQCTLGEVLRLLEKAASLYAQLKIDNETLSHSATVSQSWEEFDADLEDLAFIQTIGSYYKEYADVLANRYSYYEDRKAVRAVYKDVVQKLPDSQFISLLQNLKIIGGAQAWLDTNLEAILASAGNHYQGADTDWDKIFYNIALFKQQLPLFSDTEDAIRALSITSDSDLKSVHDYLSYLKQLEVIIEIGRDLREINLELSGESIIGLIDRLNIVVKNSTKFKSIFKVVLSHSNNFNSSYESLVESLKKLVTYSNQKALIEHSESNLNKYFPHRYDCANTNWDQIAFDIDCFERIQSYFLDFPIEPLKELLIVQNAEEILSNRQAIVTEESINHLYKQLNSVASDQKTKQCTLGEAIQFLEKVTSLYKQLKIYYETLFHSATVSQSWEEFDADLEDLVFIQTIGSYYRDHADELANRYRNRFLGLNTDWDKILADLPEVEVFKQLLVQYNLPNTFGEAACSNPEAPYDFYRVLSKNDAVEGINNLMSFVQSMFDDSFTISLAVFDDLHHRLISCLNRIDLLEKQIDYRDTRKVCCESGLASFVNAVEGQDSIISDISRAFQKAFYKKWLDVATNRSEAISGFKTRVQQERIEHFCVLDKRQLQIAQMRIREKLISDIPSRNRLLSAKDEFSVLQHQLDLKSRHMPLRKLFRSIPNLLMRLKPCLMMSPLSVSYFLEAESYQFNMVIFDEASQIFPEDAIGAIFRGAQVIIAGDSKQLPPTNYFSSNSGSVYDGGEAGADEEYNDIVYNSILEEATSNLPSRPLLWHYRSRHEHLIAFSNREIYKNELITFPSSIGQTGDMGVEYFHVSTGVYEGTSNVKEAQECVMLIRRHIQYHPDRSLGIIAFSEKQQNTIEEHVNEFIERNSQYEWFFDENRDEPFFIKNLENVQGDERDTIILSICYAKNGNGRIDMRSFGPLGKQGGERRLNVAITRAKFNVKLVGSILPTDIDLSRVNSEGVRMLRSYIEFAMKGASVLSSQKRRRGIDEDDDKFCEGVANFLENHRYKISRNVGCSDYTIDIAVEYFDYPGQFAAGIECDGNTYVMSKTARDRDHLRSSILRSMGWNLYRVWSTDWIRNPEEAKRNLICFIERALKQAVNRPVLPKQEVITEWAEGISDLVESVSQKIADKQVVPTSFKLQEYVAAVWRNAEYPPCVDNNAKIETLILYVVGIEQPIHRNLIYQRLAGVFKREKVTSIVRNNIDPFLNCLQEARLKNENDFFSLPSLTEMPMRKAGGRSIEQISIHEIGAVMIRIAKNTFGISVEELTVETARLFGFERRGPKILKIMSAAVDNLIKTGLFKIVDEKVQVMEE